jgi:hypothetical protein
MPCKLLNSLLFLAAAGIGAAFMVAGIFILLLLLPPKKPKTLED